MAEVTWGRKETIIWPPHKPIYTLGALFLGLIATGFFVYFRFIFVLSPLAAVLSAGLHKIDRHGIRPDPHQVPDAADVG